MPAIDFRCISPDCLALTSRYFSISSWPYPESVQCSKCEGIADRDYMLGSPSTGFLVPPVVHYNKRTGQYSIPGHRDDPVDRGYQKVEIRDMRMYSKLVNSINSSEMEKAQFLQAREKEFFDARLKEQRAERKQQVETAIQKGGYWAEWEDEHGRLRREWRPVTSRARKLLDASIKYADRAIEARRRRVASNSPNFHSRLLEINESERSIVDGQSKKAVFFFKK